MVSRPISLAFVALLQVASARAELQLTPREAERNLDGVKFKRLVFADGGTKEITYIPPAGWTYSGSASKLTLHPASTTQAEGTVTKTVLPEPAVFDEESLNKLAQNELASLRGRSTNVTLVSQERNPVFIGKKETILVTLSYTFASENFGLSVMILNRGNEQVRFRLVSRLEDFKELQQAFLGSHFGWENL